MDLPLLELEVQNHVVSLLLQSASGTRHRLLASLKRQRKQVVV